MRCIPLEDIEEGGSYWIQKLGVLNRKYEFLDKLLKKGYVEANRTSHPKNGSKGYNLLNEIYKTLAMVIGSEHINYNKSKGLIKVGSEGIKLLEDYIADFPY